MSDVDEQKVVVLKKNDKPSKWQKLLIILVILLSIGLGIFAYFYFNNGQPSAEQKEHESYISQIIGQAEDMSINDGTEEAIILLDKNISEEKDDYLKSKLLISKAVVLMNDDRYDEALVLLKQVEKMDINKNVYLVIAILYEKTNKYSESAKYYQLVIDNLDKDSELYNSNKNYYQNKIDYLNLPKEEWLWHGSYIKNN